MKTTRVSCLIAIEFAQNMGHFQHQKAAVKAVIGQIIEKEFEIHGNTQGYGGSPFIVTNHSINLSEKKYTFVNKI